MRARNSIPTSSLVVLAAVPAIVLGGVWQVAETNDAPPVTTTTTKVPPPPVDELTTDLLSPRRHPTPLAVRVAEAEELARTNALATELVRMLGPDQCVTMRRGSEVIFDVAGDQPLIPASTVKLLVAAVALDVLGPEFRFRTELRSLPPVDSVVPGDVYVNGGGDPVLVTADHVDPHRYPAFNTTTIDALVDQLVLVGITRIEGDVIGDGTRYDDEFRVPSWSEDITNDDAGPYDALLVNDGLIGNGNYGLVPAQSAANIVADLIEERGIDVVGSTRHDQPPDGIELTTLALVESDPLPDVLAELLHTSDNNTAEMLLKEIGLQTSGQGNRNAGISAIMSRLADWGVDAGGLALDDGSGLSRLNRVTCDVLSTVLATSPVADALEDLLPVAGRDGTLADQFVGTPAEGELAAKTGTLTGVKALAGVFDGADDEPIEFAVVLNGEGVSDMARYQPVWLELVDVITAYPVEVDADVDRFAPR